MFQYVDLNGVSRDIWFNWIARADVLYLREKMKGIGKRGFTVLEKSILNGTNSVWINRASDKEPFIWQFVNSV